ncbi:hypothetical protein D3C73_1192040 [compost metagenome]
MYIRILSVDRRHIKFKIASMHNCSFGSIKYDTEAIRYTVIRPEEGGGNRAERQDRIRIYLVQAGLLKQTVLL